jgi:pilus assembly protein Flp/PilA
MKKRFLREQDGATSIEYAVIAGLIFLVIISAIAPIGDYLKTVFEDAEAGFSEPPA